MNRKLSAATVLAAVLTLCLASAATKPAKPEALPTVTAPPVADTPYGMTLRSVSLEDLAKRDLLPLGTYKGTPQLNDKRAWYDENFYATLAARKVWPDGGRHYTHDWQRPISWKFAPIPQAAPPPCGEPQPTGYDSESCRYVGSLFKDIEATPMPTKPPRKPIPA
ncbi:MAG: hypothetical protein Q8M37_09560 [Nevskia sp.]|nr:hypothetical protein [Nevskia sp.]